MERRGHYQPLPTQRGNETFRLLRLEAGSANDPIICQLHIAEVPNDRTTYGLLLYDAVSYVWGVDEPRYEIILGAWSFFIRENLYQFLLQIRHPAEDLTLWIDALCIDQSNLDERGQQVQLMHQIFRSARRVLVWLGTAASDGLIAMKTIEQVCASSPRTIDLSSSSRHALASWSQRAYWTRSWVVQEFLLATDLLIICGASTTSWQAMLTFLRQAENESRWQTGSDLNRWSPLLESPAFMLMQQKLRQNRSPLHLSSLLIQNRSTACHDPRDKIYSMLGLATQNGNGTRIQVSYRKDPRLLLFETIEYCQIPSKDIARYVRFLVRLLKIEGGGLSSPLRSGTTPQNESRELSFDVVGFITGKVIYCDSLGSDVPASPLDLGRYRTDSKFLKQADIGPGEISTVIEKLEAVDMNRLRMGCDDLDAISRRTWQSGATYSDDLNLPEQPETSLALVFTSVCVRKEILVAVACGKIKKGDAVMHLPGHEIAIAMHVRNARLQYGHFTGRLLCAQQALSKNVSDVITGQDAEAYIIQNEADCDEPVTRISFRASASEMLSLCA